MVGMRRSAVLVAVLAVAAAGVTQVAPSATTATSTAGATGLATFVRTIGGPGHAGLYAWGMATATDGSILVGDYWNYRILRFDTGGQLLETISEKGRGVGQNMGPHGLAVDRRDGSFYVADMNGPQKIKKFDAQGRELWAIRPYVYGVTSPYPYVTRLAVDSTGLVYLVDSHNVPETFANKILVYNPDGTYRASFGVNGKEPGKFGLLRGIAIDASDNLYIVDAGQGVVQVFDKSGRYLRSFGKGYFPGDMRGITIDAARDRVYVADTLASQVEVFTLAGAHLMTFGARGTGPGQFGDGPRDFAVDASGRLFASDFGNTRVNVYDGGGRFLFDFPNPVQPARPDGFNQPEDVAVTRDGSQVWTIDGFNHRVQHWTPDAQIVNLWGFRGNTQPQAMAYPRGVAIDPRNGDVWVSNSRYGDIKRYRRDGTLVSRWGSWGFGTDYLQLARGLTVGADGTVYVTDSNNRLLKAFTETGARLWSVPCGAPYEPGGMALLMGCTGVVQDARGNLYAAAPTEHAIYKFARDGTLLKKWGSLGTGNGQLSRPYDVALWRGRLYVSEMRNQRISVFDTTGNYIGRFGAAGVNPGQLKTPAGVSVDDAGRLYVMEITNERLSVFQLH